MNNHKKRNNTLFYTLICGCVLATSFGLVLHKKNMSSLNEENSSIIYEEGEKNGDFHLNYSNIKSKKIGDEFTITATINENATFQSVTFEVSNNEALETIKLTSNSITLKRVKDFEDYITVKVTSDDPFVNAEETCTIRCYNNFTGFVTINTSSISDGTTSYTKLKAICAEDEFILKKGLNYSGKLLCSSTFSYLNGENGYDGNTRVLLEDDTMEDIKSLLEDLFLNTITSFSQDLLETDYNQISFSFVYNNELNFSSQTISKKLTYESYSLNVYLTQYVSQSFLLDKEGIQVI